MLRDTYQKQYDLEHSHRAELSAGVGTPVAAVALVASATAVAFFDYPYSPALLTYAFYAFVAVTMASLATASFYVFRSLWNYKYEKLASPLELLRFQSGLAEWYEREGESHETAHKRAEAEITEGVIQKLCEATHWNAQINLRRGNFLHMGTTALALALSAFLLLACLYAVAKATSPEKTTSVRIINLPLNQPEKTMTTQSPKPASPPAASPAVPSAAPSAPTISPAKPQMPNNSQFRTNTEIPVPRADRGGNKP